VSDTASIRVIPGNRSQQNIFKLSCVGKHHRWDIDVRRRVNRSELCASLQISYGFFEILGFQRFKHQFQFGPS
jgi:hypothetical protein